MIDAIICRRLVCSYNVGKKTHWKGKSIKGKNGTPKRGAEKCRLETRGILVDNGFVLLWFFCPPGDYKEGGEGGISEGSLVEMPGG